MAFIGVIILPITSGDTAFRSARLIISEIFKIKQSRIFKRVVIAIPLFIIAFIISTQNFNMIWRYFGWANQTLAMLVLWTAAIYLAKRDKFHWIASIPATFMTAVSFTYIFQAEIGFSLNAKISCFLGIVISFAAFIIFFIKYAVSRTKISI